MVGPRETKALRDQINTLNKVPFQGQTLSKDVLDPKQYPFIFLLGPTYRGPGDHRYELGQQKGAKTFAFLHADVEYGRGPVRNAMEAKSPKS